jgi:hypothetical protein
MSDVVPFLIAAPRVCASLEEFTAAFEQRRVVARKRFAPQDKQLHSRLDMELTSKIDQLYRDSLGPWESGDADWWAQHGLLRRWSSRFAIRFTSVSG